MKLQALVDNSIMPLASMAQISLIIFRITGLR